ncbi:hypothetical protein BCR36DRAFT_375466 [Piromyces finnis]|uniref:Uncharacterized protein n=1 Tax=Piromyces finnis TaxID=1754191 RepID=A0A1Y1UQR8_9FUNG|nr:hypothetical protein BCR36DRAFT_375466 [Piromyces finnis]|eukprot:ORX40400.1 hypothetical protein BCR36DRAFT_375466 [Piromyces finnis]
MKLILVRGKIQYENKSVSIVEIIQNLRNINNGYYPDKDTDTRIEEKFKKLYKKAEYLICNKLGYTYDKNHSLFEKYSDYYLFTRLMKVVLPLIFEVLECTIIVILRMILEANILELETIIIILFYLTNGSGRIQANHILNNTMKLQLIANACRGNTECCTMMKNSDRNVNFSLIQDEDNYYLTKLTGKDTLEAKGIIIIPE